MTHFLFHDAGQARFWKDEGIGHVDGSSRPDSNDRAPLGQGEVGVHRRHEVSVRERVQLPDVWAPPLCDASDRSGADVFRDDGFAETRLARQMRGEAKADARGDGLFGVEASGADEIKVWSVCGDLEFQPFPVSRLKDSRLERLGALARTLQARVGE